MGTQSTTTVDFGAVPVDEGSFVIVDANLAGLTYAEVWIMMDSTADNTVLDHEIANALMRTACSISGTNLTVHCFVEAGLVTGQFKLRYAAN